MANFLVSLIIKRGFQGMYSIHLYSNLSKLEGKDSTLQNESLRPLPVYSSGPALHSLANFFWIHLSSCVNYRGRTTIQQKASSPSSQLSAVPLCINHFEVARIGEYTFFASAPPSQLSSSESCFHETSNEFLQHFLSPQDHIQPTPCSSSFLACLSNAPSSLLHCNLLFYSLKIWGLMNTKWE